MKGRPPKIDLMRLAANSSTAEWNRFLTKCLRSGNLLALETALHGLQQGMNDLVKDKLNTEAMSVLFIRLQMSLEITMKKIIRARQPNPLDNPLNKKKWMSKHKDKKARDEAIANYIRKMSF